MEASCAVDPSLPLMWSSLLATVVTGEKTTLFSFNMILNRMSASQLGVVVGSHELYSEDPDQESFAVREVQTSFKLLVINVVELNLLEPK